MYTTIREWTTAQERMAIAKKHGVKTRAQISNILNGKSTNVPLLEEMMELAERHKAQAEGLKDRAKALGA